MIVRVLIGIVVFVIVVVLLVAGTCGLMSLR
jgi:hypothetical protein